MAGIAYRKSQWRIPSLENVTQCSEMGGERYAASNPGSLQSVCSQVTQKFDACQKKYFMIFVMVSREE